MGCLFQSTTDTEVINHLVARSNYSTVVDRLIDALQRVKGAYSLLLLSNEALFGVRDPLGVRPLVLGRLDDAWILCSETCALDIIGARFVRDVEPGEIVIIDGNGLRSIKPFTRQPRRFCIFEHIYFARPDSKVEGVGVYDARNRIGVELARESPVLADVDRCRCSILGVAGGDRLCPASPARAVRARHHPQPLCRAHLHRTKPTISAISGAAKEHNANRAVWKARRVDPGRRYHRTRRPLKSSRWCEADAAGSLRIASPPTTDPLLHRRRHPCRDHPSPANAPPNGCLGARQLAFPPRSAIPLVGDARPAAGSTRHTCDACFGDFSIPLTDVNAGTALSSSPNRQGGGSVPHLIAKRSVLKDRQHHHQFAHPSSTFPDTPRNGANMAPT